MKVLLIKTSSMGDVLHTLPALTDAAQRFPEIQFDWVVEQAFAEIPGWHPAVNKVIPCALRRWRKQPWLAWKSGEWHAFYQMLRQQNYDLVLDAQGLLKSAFITLCAKGKRAGLNFQSAWEPLASFCYQQRYSVNPQQHAVARVRQLFAAALKYPVPTSIPDYGLDRNRLLKSPDYQDNYLVFLHGTTWATKHWPENYWRQLAALAAQAGYQVLLPWGNDSERQRAENIAQALTRVTVLPKMNLEQMAALLAHAKGVVAVDTGLGHMAAAFAVPTVNLYGPTDPALTGTVGAHQQHLAAQFICAPCLQRQCTYRGAADVQPACFSTLTPAQVWSALKTKN